jgi:hypothetical protein
MANTRALNWLLPPSIHASQGGMFIFDGPRCMLSHYDQATGAHADFASVLGVAQQLAGDGKDCGCPQ